MLIGLLIRQFLAVLSFHKFTNGLDFVVEHFLSQARVGAEEDRGVHDGVGSGECVGDTGVVDFREGCGEGTYQADGLGAVFAHLHEDGLSEEIAAKEHTVANLFFIQVESQGAMGEGRGRLDSNHETKPRAVGAATGGVPREVGNLRLET